MIIVNNRVDTANLPQGARDLIARIAATNQSIKTEAVLGGKVDATSMMQFIQERAAPMGAHGNKQLYVSAEGRTTSTLLAIGGLHSIRPTSKAGYFWMAYARSTPPAHAGNDICTLAEFPVTGTNAQTRLLYEYLRGFFLWTTNHYQSYSLVETNGVLVRHL
ncbi:hypothetical protein E2493_19245 [Sphingomonas parva]|uniref:Uncharacterized protein n=1 Tax=Sphingomonas parva TaxID=2555898 RepID=A0A4Y8ZKT8_9SPHN|nr:hypothetical protein [Sphingomonas parva]TFI56621.1 hypothetical protein E2493_19245 [Sphingomonas parva]